MKPLKHIIFGFIFSLFLFIIFPKITFIGVLIIFLSSFLIDIDHYIYYVFKEKTLNPYKAIKSFFIRSKKLIELNKNQRKKFYLSFNFLHGLEILLILIILGKIISFYFYYVLIGFAFHLILDYLDILISNKRFDKISIIYDFIKFKKLKYFR